MPKVKSLNGHQINIMERDLIDEEVKKEREFSPEHFMIGRSVKPYYLMVNGRRIKFSNLETAESFCNSISKVDLKKMSHEEIKSYIQENNY